MVTCPNIVTRNGLTDESRQDRARQEERSQGCLICKVEAKVDETTNQ